MERIRKPKEIKNRILNGLRDKGFKLTPQRLEIIDIVSRDRSHPTAQRIFQKARKRVLRLTICDLSITATARSAGADSIKNSIAK